MKVARSVVLQNLSNTADPAPSSPPTSAHATAPALAPAEKVPGEPLESISQTGLDGLKQESASSQSPAKRQKKQLRELTYEEEEDRVAAVQSMYLLK